MKKHKNKIYLVIVSVLIILIVIAGFIKSQTKEEITLEKEEIDEAKSLTENNIDELVSEDITYDKFTKLIGKEVANVHINLGPNSYLRNRPSEEVIKEYHLEKYIKLQDQLANRVEKRYLDNLNYKIIKTEPNENGGVCQTIKITSYYYALYLTDLINLTNELVTGELANVSTDLQTELEYFKSQLLALKVLDKHLDDYENVSKESINHKICYDSNNHIDSDALLGFVGALQGEDYSNNNFSDENNIYKADLRLKQYLIEAENTSIF